MAWDASRTVEEVKQLAKCKISRLAAMRYRLYCLPRSIFRKEVIVVKNQKKVVALLVMFALCVSIIGIAAVAYGSEKDPYPISQGLDCPKCGSSNTGETAIEGHRYLGKCKNCGTIFHWGGHTDEG
jgi:hypothetical protein